MKIKAQKYKNTVMQYGMLVMLAYCLYLLLSIAANWYMDIINKNFTYSPQIQIMNGQTFYIPQEQNKKITLSGFDKCISNDSGDVQDCIIVKAGLINVLVAETGKVEHIIVKNEGNRTFITNENNHFLSSEPNK